MRQVWLRILAGALAICLCGCIVPLRDEVSAGHRYPAEALLFLDSPSTTREDVIATLGPPILESTNHLTLVYAWGQTPRFSYSYPFPFGNEERVARGDEQYYCLFIAYGADKRVLAHSVRYAGERDYEEVCADWSRKRRARVKQ